MKIKKLTLSAFGPFAGREEIDFTAFSGKVFLIGGDTGAGKTSILDGICFALYGTPSGSLRKDFTLRNQDAPPKAESFAELVFTGRDGRDYTVRRCTKPMRRPDDAGSKKVSASKEDVTLTGGDSPVTGVRDVNKWIEKLTGFDRDAFLRVSILPQGEFDKFLTASTADRIKTLRTIFGTELYSAYSDVVKSWTANVNRALAAADSTCGALLNNTFGTEGGTYLLADGQEYLKQLNDRAGELQTRQTEAEQKRDALQGKLLQNRTDRAAANSANQRLAALNAALGEKAALEGRSGEYEAKEKTLELNRAAAAAKPVLDKRNAARSGLNDVVSSISGAEKELDRAGEALKRALAEQGEAKALSGEHERLIGEISGLTKLKDKFNEVNKKRDGISRLEREAERLHAGLTENQAAQLVCRKAAGELDGQIREAETAGARIPGLRSETGALAGSIAGAEKLISDIGEVNALAEQAEGASERCGAADKAAETAKLEYEKLQMRYSAGEIARIAKKLEINMPCPVCGSESHPAPAHWTEDIPSAKELEKAERSMRAAQQKKAAADTEYAGLSGQLRAMSGDVQNRFSGVTGEEYGDNAMSVVSGVLEGLKERLNRLNGELGECVRAEKSLPGLKKALSEREAEQQRLSDGERALNEQISANSSSRSAEEAVLNGLLAELGGRTEQQLGAELDEKTSRADGIKLRQENADRAVSAANAGKTAALTSLERYREQRCACEDELNKAEQELKAKLEECGFGGEDEVTANYADPAAVRVLEQDIAAYKEKVVSAGTKMIECEKELPDEMRRQKPEERRAIDLTVFDEKERQYSEDIGRLQQEIKALSAEQHQFSNAAVQLGKLIEGSRELAEQQKLLNDLNSAINGTAGADRISFETFVQMKMFRGVLEEANTRLDKMSGGRYQFALRTQGFRANSAEGLDIDIIDYNSGSQARRDVSTLSGGERFMASFSLAIGLSDYTLRQGAGRQSDMLFIDEGFSSLDTTTFGQALEVIEKLSGGSRMIGVVTHITEIQEYFRDTQIYVRKEKGTSSIS